MTSGEATPLPAPTMCRRALSALTQGPAIFNVRDAKCRFRDQAPSACLPNRRPPLTETSRLWERSNQQAVVCLTLEWLNQLVAGRRGILNVNLVSSSVELTVNSPP